MNRKLVLAAMAAFSFSKAGFACPGQSVELTADLPVIKDVSCGDVQKQSESWREFGKYDRDGLKLCLTENGTTLIFSKQSGRLLGVCRSSLNIDYN